MKHAQVAGRAAALFSVSAPVAVACGLQVAERGKALFSAGPSTVDELVGGAAALGGWAVLGWIALTVGIAAVAVLPGALGAASARLASAVTPGFVRRAVVVVVGVTVASGAAPAFASTPTSVTGAPPTAPAFAYTSTSVTGGPPTVTGAVLTASTSGLDHRDWPLLDRPTTPEVAVVGPGDCLWTIAARHLEPNVTPAEVAAEWPRWYAANRALIGPDPDLIHPGQRLVVPPVP